MHYLLNRNKKYEDIIAVDNLFTEAELDNLVVQLSNEELRGSDVGVSFNLTPEEYEKYQLDPNSIRRSNICWLDKEKYTWLYQKCEEAINHVNLNYNKVLYGIEPLQYTEYGSNYKGYYGPHIDHFSGQPLSRSLSFTIQLSKPEEYEGGDLLIYSADTKHSVQANKQYGCVTFFDSKILHEVTPVTSGLRKSLVGWIVGPTV
jgi:PKHD-type hydroxylase